MKTLNSLHLKKCLMLALAGLLILAGGCKKYIEVPGPYTSANADIVYGTDATAASVVTGIYAAINTPNNPLGRNISSYVGVASDELTQYYTPNTDYAPYYTNTLTPLTAYGPLWTQLYKIVSTANLAIEGISASNALSANVKTQLLGECKFMRAFAYFYLVNIYGEVGLSLTTDVKTNTSLPRSSVDKVYTQIITDLTEAKAQLNAQYVNADAVTVYAAGSQQRVRPTKAAASAMLARVYLYRGDYARAEAEATEVINNTTLFGLVALDDVFKLNSKETIWSMPSTGNLTQANTAEGRLFIIPSTGPNNVNPLGVGSAIYNAFETTDQRKTKWVGTLIQGTQSFYYPNKYKIAAVNTTVQEYSVVLRLAELFLIRAEARAQQANLTGANSAQSDLNTIRTRAGLLATTATSKTDLLAAIATERETELFSEWAHRWFDLKRTGVINTVMPAVAIAKGSTWQAYKALFPIPQNELIVNPNATQNPGY